jgi:lipopolysaccharide biosynthesis proteins, LPS:glycosyltransferases
MKKIIPFSPEKNIPIVFATDETYAPYMSVTLQSILEHISTHLYYDFLVLTNGLSLDTQEKLTSQVSKYINCSIRFLNIIDFIDIDAKKFEIRAYYSIVTYYRIFIPHILSEYDKIIYVDCDMLLFSDISDIFLNTDMSDKYMAGAPDIGIIKLFYENKKIANYLKKEIGINDVSMYLQAGFIIFNLNMMRKDSIMEKMISRLDKGYLEWQDQDLLNFACKNKIVRLPMEWNIIYIYAINKDTLREKIPMEIYRSFINSCDNIKCMHFANFPRPWTNPNFEEAIPWWETSGRTPFSYELIRRLSYNIEQQTKNNLRCNRKIYSFFSRNLNTKLFFLKKYLYGRKFISFIKNILKNY